MRITEAARILGTSARMLRYRESLGLLPLLRPPGGQARPQPAHQQFTKRDLDAVALGLAIERRYDISPAALAFGLKVMTDPAARSQVAELGRRTGRIGSPVTRALDFEQERALRLLGLGPAGGAAARGGAPGAGSGGPAHDVRPGHSSGSRSTARTAGSAASAPAARYRSGSR
jgi:MerR family transcriptional regulator, copper efflux regulator